MIWVQSVCEDADVAAACRTRRDVPLGHRLEDFRCAKVAVLDGIHTRQNRVPHPFGARRMSGTLFRC
jgi:hypothetical protein